MKTDLTINSTSATDGKKVTNKISYVNPNLTNREAITLAQAISSLTTDSYTKTTRTDTTDCDTTTSRPITSIKYRRKADVSASSSSWYDVPADGNITFAENLIGGKSLQILIDTIVDGQAPTVYDVTDDSQTPVDLNNYQFGGPIGDTVLKKKWFFTFNNGMYAQDQTAITPRTVSFKIKFNGTHQYDAWEKTFTFTITGGE